MTPRLKQAAEAEVWRPLHFDNPIEVSNLGRIRTSKGISIGAINAKGYLTKNFCVNGINKYFKVHRLVLLAFVGPSSLVVNHKNGIKADNRLSNLEYVTRKENNSHARTNGLARYAMGEKNGHAKLTAKLVREIRKSTKSNVQWGRELGINTSTIRFARLGFNWGHVK